MYHVEQAVSKPETSAARARLLDEVIDHISAEGLGELTLRGLAAGIGTSHRMLIYHFGSKEGLLLEVVRQVEDRQRAALAEVGLTADATGAEIIRAMWERLASPALAANERLFFELYGQALQGRAGTTALLDDVVDAWIEPAVDVLLRLGFPPAHAVSQARLGIAVTRGLLLDLLATGDRAACDAAMEQYIRVMESFGSEHA